MTFRANHLYTDGPEVQGAFGVDTLPLTTVAHIISYLDDDVASLARLCRTSRVLFYMTLPHLWKSVNLRSYSTIRYKDDVPEGFGSASPFSMGLNALVTRNVSSLVRSLCLEGELGTSDLHGYSRAGRISESTMILNIAVRAAVDQCIHLEKFSWDLNVRPLPNVYGGLTKRSQLRELWLRFPNNRSPQPSSEIPPFPNLRSLTITHYDPLCFPDDISTLLLHAASLENLQMHFSPRMRDQGESSVVLTHFFRKNIASKKKLRIKRMGVYNLLAGADMPECLEAIDTLAIEDFTSLNTFGVDEGTLGMYPSATHFIDRTWLIPADKHHPSPKSIRMDQLHKRHAMDLAKSAGLKRLYLVNARYKPEGYSQSPPISAEVSPHPGVSLNCSNHSARTTPTPNTSLRDLYLDNICGVCGPTLQHLLLPARWPLPPKVVARLVRSCPNLTQLAVATEYLESDVEVLRMLISFLDKLSAIRILLPKAENEQSQKQLAMHTAFINQPDSLHEEMISRALMDSTLGGGTDLPCLRYIGLEPKVWEVGEIVEEVVRKHTNASQGEADGSQSSDKFEPESANEVVYRRRVIRLEEKDVNHVEIWKMDSQNVI